MFFFFFYIIYSCDGKAEFSAAITQVFMSYDLSEITLICWFGAQENIRIITEENCLLF